MDASLQQAHLLSVELRHRIEALETGRVSGYEVEAGITNSLEKLANDIRVSEGYVFREPASRRHVAKTRISQLQQDLQGLQTAFSHYNNRKNAKESEAKEREELLHRRFKPNEDDDTTIMIDAAIKENSQLRRADAGMDAILGSGSSILESLHRQRSTLKGARRRLLDIANTLGLSNTVMRFIERRGAQDKWILIGGMVITCVVMWATVHYFT
eukprot:Opistho-2@64900